MSKYGNIEKMISLSKRSWRLATDNGLTGIRTVRADGNKLESTTGHRFLNMVCCSYLGLNRHPRVLEGAIRAIREEGTMSTSVSRARIGPALLDETESLMGEVYGAPVVLTVSCSMASAGVLPVLASGHMTGGKKPLMIFDSHSHFSMNVMKAACGNETEVVTCEHNDIDFIEAACKQNDSVAYVADGAYSMGGNAPVSELRRLQEKYGLFLYLDDSHSLSVYGERGQGLVRSHFDRLTDRTIIVGSLAKAFGATGGVIMLGNPAHRELLDFFAGPLGWSQMLNAAGLGAIHAAAEIHLSDELEVLQQRLRGIMAYFDSTVPTVNAGNGLPIRVIDLPNVDAAVEISAEVYRRGFYSSAVFFPIVSRGRAGLRVMGRADMEESDIREFCSAIEEFIGPQAVPVPIEDAVITNGVR